MAITLPSFAGADTDYIGKMNQGNALIAAAINSLQVALQGGNFSAVNNALFMYGIAGGVTMRIGSESYDTSPSGSTLTISAGTAWLSTSQSVVQLLASTPLSFSGQPSDTYYIDVDSGGVPARTDTLGLNSLWSVVWTGSAFGTITAIAPALNSAADDTAQRVRYHKIGCSGNGNGSVVPTGVIGTPIQADFAGTIIGWSLHCDQPGNIEIAVNKVAGFAPPADPTIPDAGDKISASAPVEIAHPSGAQSAAQDASGVSSWTTTTINLWDSLQFEVVSVSLITKFTLYLRILEN